MTTAKMAQRTESFPDRLWPDKQAMFLVATDDNFRSPVEQSSEIPANHPAPEQAVERIIEYESDHQG